MIPAARAVREQVDWDEVAAAVADNDFAVVTLDLLRRLGRRSLARTGRDLRHRGATRCHSEQEAHDHDRATTRSTSTGRSPT